jgi:hypothetical protein
VPPPSAPAPARTLPPSGRRGTPGKARGYQGTSHDLLGGIAHAADLTAGTAFNVAGGPNIAADILHPIQRYHEVRREGLVPLKQAAGLAQQTITREMSRPGFLPKNFRIPSIDIVPPAGAAGPNRPVTADEFKQLAQHGYDLSPRLDARFTKQALKNGWTAAELDGLSGGAKIDKAFSKPPPEPLRVAANFGKGIAQLGEIPSGLVGAGREVAAGHGLKVAQALGEGLYSELPVVGKHPFVQTLQSDPFGTITQFAGAGKTVGDLARLGKIGKVAAERMVTTPSGLAVNRGELSKNAYTALGQSASDTAARHFQGAGGRLEAKAVDEAVRMKMNTHAPEYVPLQRAYHAALDKVGRKRAEELSAFQLSGGKPEQIAAFYRAQGLPKKAEYFDRVAERTKALAPEDHAFMDAHNALAAKTTQSNIDIGKFGDLGANFRRYSPLIRSSARLGNPESQRILALRDEYLKGFNTMEPQDLEALRGAIDQGVQDFRKGHLAAGGSEPAYVKYSQPKPVVASPFTPGPGGAVGFKTPRGRQKAETGGTFESGQYIIDPTSPLAESVRAQRTHLASVLHDDVARAVGTHVTAGDAIKPGNVFVSETNLRGLRRTTNDLADAPVGASDYYAQEAATRQGIFDKLKNGAVPSGQVVPRGEKGWMIPEAAYQRILDHTRPPSRGAYDKFLRQYQRVLISYRPSTIVNNTVGSLPLAALAGAGPKSFARSARAMRNPELAPAVLRGRGVAGSLAPDVRSRVGSKMDWMRAQSQRGEDFSRLAAFFSKAGPHIEKRAKQLNVTADEYARDFASGKADPQKLNEFIDHATKFVGDVAMPDSKLGHKLGKAILFHQWVGHIAKLLLFTLPVSHPRRFMVLQALGAYGNQYRQQHGVWPDWYAEYLPLFQHTERIGNAGKAQTFTKSFSTQGVNPFSTLNQFASPVSTSDTLPNIISGVLAPPLQIGLNTVFNRPTDSHSAARYALGQTIRQIPGVSVIRPQSGMASDSIPFISEQRKVYSSGRKRNGKSVPLPYDFRPTARPEGGILGALVRYGLGGVYDVPAQGPIHNIDQGKHIGSAAKAGRKAR